MIVHASQYSTQIYEPQRMKQGRNLGEQFYTNPACFLDLFAETPVGVSVHCMERVAYPYCQTGTGGYEFIVVICVFCT